jgi:putative flippase GtrA
MGNEPRRKLPDLATLLRSAGVGTVVTVVDLALLTALVSAFDVPTRIASPLVLAVGVAIQFLGNKLLAFRDTSPRWARQASAFLLVEGLGFVANVVAFDIAVHHVPLPYLVLRIATTSLVYFGICLPLWTRIFAAPLAEEGAA